MTLKLLLELNILYKYVLAYHPLSYIWFLWHLDPWWLRWVILLMEIEHIQYMQ